MNLRPSRYVLITAALALAACRAGQPTNAIRASGNVEATEIQVASQVGGRLLALEVGEGDQVRQGQVIARLDTTDVELTRRRAQAEREQAVAQLRLLQAGARREDIRQAEAQVTGGQADVAAANAELASAEADLKRFEDLLRSNSGSVKQRDDAATRRDVARERVSAAQERVKAGTEAVARLRSGARPEEIDVARARVAAADAQIAMLDQNVKDATVTAPAGGIVTEKLADVGELLAPRAPILVVTDLAHAWANIYVDERSVPRLRLGQPATIRPDGTTAGLPGTVTFIASKAEFTPRNVQTAEERSKLVYRIKVSTDNRIGVLKQGMPVEADLSLK